MDQATIMRILERQGAENTPDNINRIIQAAASDPSILERYSMGTAPAQVSSGPGRQDIRGGGGLDDNAALLNLQGRQPTIERKSSTQTYDQAPPAPVQRAAPAPTPARRGVAPNTEPPPGTVPPPPVGADGSLDWLKYLLLVPGFRGKPTAPQLPPPFVPGRQRPPGDMNAPRITQQGPEAVYQGPMQRGDVTTPNRGGPLQNVDPNDPRFNRPQPQITDVETPGGTLRPGGAATNRAGAPPPQPQVEAPPARPGITGGNPPTYPSGAPTMGAQPGLDLENQRIQDEIDMKEQIARQNAANKPKPDVVRPGKRPPRIR